MPYDTWFKTWIPPRSRSSNSFKAFMSCIPISSSLSLNYLQGSSRWRRLRALLPSIWRRLLPLILWRIWLRRHTRCFFSRDLRALSGTSNRDYQALLIAAVSYVECCWAAESWTLSGQPKHLEGSQGQWVVRSLYKGTLFPPSDGSQPLPPWAHSSSPAAGRRDHPRQPRQIRHLQEHSLYTRGSFVLHRW